jgi:hypothetical protein
MASSNLTARELLNLDEIDLNKRLSDIYTQKESCYILYILFKTNPYFAQFLIMFLMLVDKSTSAPDEILGYVMQYMDFGITVGGDWCECKPKWQTFFHYIIDAINEICEIPEGIMLHVVMIDGSPVTHTSEGVKIRDLNPGIMICACQKGSHFLDVETVQTNGIYNLTFAFKDQNAIVIPGKPGYKSCNAYNVKCLSLQEVLNQPPIPGRRGLIIGLFGSKRQSTLQILQKQLNAERKEEDRLSKEVEGIAKDVDYSIVEVERQDALLGDVDFDAFFS